MMTSHNLTAERERREAKEKLVQQLDYALGLAREIERQAKCIAEIVQSHHRLPIAA
jgi:hypothetical protein